MATTKEYIDAFIAEVNEEIQWKYLKSSRTLKKKIGDVVFEIAFYSSKYNGADAQIEIRSECRVWCDYGMVAIFSFLENWDYWWDITSASKCQQVKRGLVVEIEKKVLPIVSMMQEDFAKGAMAMVTRDSFDRFSGDLQFIDECVGREQAIGLAKSYVDNFSTADWACVKSYLNGTDDLCNEHNLKYLIDNKLAEVE